MRRFDSDPRLQAIEQEIFRLKHARALLAGHDGIRPAKERTLNADARARIAAAQKKRWAKLWKRTAKKAAQQD